jgi:nucleoside-diphosphate-sugar epimerase
MRIAILGYTGLIGNSILQNLIKNNSLHIICVGRDIKYKPYRNSRIKYCKWDFTSFDSFDLSFLNKANVIINCVGKTYNKDNNFENINVIFVKKLLKHINSFKHKVRLVHLSSVAVYGGIKTYFCKNKLISEDSTIKVNDLYSKSKSKGDLLVQNICRKNLNKNFSYTILRITNVFGGKKKSNLFRFLRFSLKLSLWIKCYNDIMFNFVNVNDVSQAVILTLTKLKVSKNKIYIVSDDCKQHQFYKNYESFYQKKIIKTQVSVKIIKFLIYYFPLPRKIINFISIISTRVSYSNKKIKKELNFNPRFSLVQKIKFIND